jgi:hypothetical protein
MKLFQTLLMVSLALTSVATTAQWQWVDKDGRKVFSDRAPPTDILDKNIIKRPAGREPSAAATDTTVSGTETNQTAPAAPLAQAKDAGIDKDLDAKKKQAAAAELAKRKADEERVTKAKIENCARSKQAKASFDSGVRISRTNAAGEREVMDDATRAAELNRIQAVIATDCK